MTPDFKIADLVIELKDLQKDSLYNEDRRLTIAKIFESESGYSININFSTTSGHCQTRYKRAIANSIKNIISKASTCDNIVRCKFSEFNIGKTCVAAIQKHIPNMS